MSEEEKRKGRTKKTGKDGLKNEQKQQQEIRKKKTKK